MPVKLFFCYVSSPRFTGSPALPVLSHCVDPPRNQCRTALRHVSPKKSSLTHCVGVRCLTRPLLAAFFIVEHDKCGRATKPGPVQVEVSMKSVPLSSQHTVELTAFLPFSQHSPRHLVY